MLIPYYRQSRKREHTISIDEQRRAVQAWAARAGVELAREVVEQGVSGNRPWRERELGAVVEACEHGQASGVVVAYQSRLSREHGLATAEVWEALQRVGARLVCVAENIDTSTGDHELMFSIQAAIARDQWKKFRESGTRARANAVERGVHVGPVPVGYRRGEAGRLEPNEHAEAIRRAFEQRAAGASWTTIARFLTDVGVPTRTGKPWSLKATEKLLRNESYLGIARSGDFRNVEAHPALVGKALFERVQRTRETRTRHSDKTPGLLSGLLVCAGCGHKLVQDFVTRNGERTPFYRCRNDGACSERASITHKRVEPFVEQRALEVLGAIDYRRRQRGEATDGLRRAAHEAREELETFVELTSARTPGYAAGVARREAALAAAEDALAAAADDDEEWVFLSETETAEAYRHMPPAAQRKVMRALVREARVRRGAGPVEERVSITFAERPLRERPSWMTQPLEYVASDS